MVVSEVPPATTTTGLLLPGGGVVGVTFTVTVWVSVWPFWPVATQVYVVSVAGKTLYPTAAAAGWNRMPASVTVTAPVVWQASVMAVPGDGEAGGVAVNEVILGGGITITLTVAVAVTEPAGLVAVSV